MKQLNIIGDIHGRTVWEKLIVSDAINIFVGDYFSPYVDIPYEACAKNFERIMEYKKSNPDNVVTLIGNHDLDHWYKFDRGCSRHDYHNEAAMRILFEKNSEYLQAAYCNGDVLVTHAGVSAPWMARYTYKSTDDEIISEFGFCMDYRNMQGENLDSAKNIEEAISKWANQIGMEVTFRNGTILFWKSSYWIFVDKEWKEMTFTPQSVCDFVNRMWKERPVSFSFGMNMSRGDCYGDTITQSPMWIRYDGLCDTNVFRGNSDYLQVYGHTQNYDIVCYSDETYRGKQWQIDNKGKMIMIDCLGKTPKSLLVDMDNERVVDIKENVIPE